jgi:hypothetical protein
MTESRSAVQDRADGEIDRDGFDRNGEPGAGAELLEAGGMATVPKASRMRRGAIWGACLGFLVGLIPLLASTIVFTIAGALLARASEMRIEAGSAPRIHFRPNKAGQQTPVAD